MYARTLYILLANNGFHYVRSLSSTDIVVYDEILDEFFITPITYDCDLGFSFSGFTPCNQ